jgi:hypothetical protein
VPKPSRQFLLDNKHAILVHYSLLHFVLIKDKDDTLKHACLSMCIITLETIVYGHSDRNSSVNTDTVHVNGYAVRMQ